MKTEKRKGSNKYLYTFDSTKQKNNLLSELKKKGDSLQTTIKKLLSDRFPHIIN